jgi:hypothetical protein
MWWEKSSSFRILYWISVIFKHWTIDKVQRYEWSKMWYAIFRTEYSWITCSLIFICFNAWLFNHLKPSVYYIYLPPVGNIKVLYTLSTECASVFCRVLSTSSNYFPTQRKLFVIVTQTDVYCAVRNKDKYNPGQFSSLKGWIS